MTAAASEPLLLGILDVVQFVSIRMGLTMSSVSKRTNKTEPRLNEQRRLCWWAASKIVFPRPSSAEIAKAVQRESSTVREALARVQRMVTEDERFRSYAKQALGPFWSEEFLQ